MSVKKLFNMVNNQQLLWMKMKSEFLIPKANEKEKLQ